VSFSAHSRSDSLRAIQDESFDLLIIGGGITGAGIALDAATRGLKTVLIERNDFAFGTSSRSTKLIHGGLRYLKQLEFALVKEVGSERAIVHNLVPHLVVPEKMLLPLYERRGLGYWLASVGLMIYDWLAGVKPEDQRRMLTKPQTLRHEPLLKADDIKGGALYAEYRTDDARLTIEIAKEAHAKGALLINYLAVTDFRYENDQVQGVKVRDMITGATMSVRARSVVNAAGPWVDELRERGGLRRWLNSCCRPRPLKSKRHPPRRTAIL
jgi:glycerol-3-phosphate dehydrogenase